MNDLESDPEYAHFPRSVHAFLQPVWPGQLHYVAKNLFNIILVVDPANYQSVDVLSDFAALIRQNIPMRVGVLLYAPKTESADPVCNEAGECAAQKSSGADVARLIAKMFHHVRRHSGDRAAFEVFSMVKRAAAGSVTMEAVESVLRTHTKFFNSFSAQSAEYDEAIDATNKYVESMQLTKTPLVFVNGALLEGGRTRRGTSSGTQTTCSGRRSPAASAWARSRTAQGTPRTAPPSTHTHRSSRRRTQSRGSASTPSPRAVRKKKFVSLAGLPTETARYFHTADPEEVKQLSVVACADLGSEDAVGRKLLTTLAKGLRRESRLAIFPGAGASEQVPALWKALYALAHVSNTKNGLEEVVNTIGATPTDSIEGIISAIKDAEIANDVKKFLEEHDDAFFRKAFDEQSGFCAAVSKDSKPSVVVNGRVVEIEEATPFEETDFTILQDAELPAANAFASNIQRIALREDTLEFRNDVLMKVVSQIVHDSQKSPGSRVSIRNYLIPSFSAGKGPATALVNIDFVADPVSRAAQRYAPILERLAETLPVRIRVYLAPQEGLRQAPPQDVLPLRAGAQGLLRRRDGRPPPPPRVTPAGSSPAASPRPASSRWGWTSRTSGSSWPRPPSTTWTTSASTPPRRVATRPWMRCSAWSTSSSRATATTRALWSPRAASSSSSRRVPPPPPWSPTPSS